MSEISKNSANERLFYLNQASSGKERTKFALKRIISSILRTVPAIPCYTFTATHIPAVILNAILVILIRSVLDGALHDLNKIPAITVFKYLDSEITITRDNVIQGIYSVSPSYLDFVYISIQLANYTLSYLKVNFATSFLNTHVGHHFTREERIYLFDGAQYLTDCPVNVMNFLVDRSNELLFLNSLDVEGARFPGDLETSAD